LIQQLAYLVALADEQHFGRAAAHCHVSQSALSAGIQRLERELSAQLVQRGHGFEGLTQDGERALAWARRILADVDHLRDEVVNEAAWASTTLRLGVIPTALSVTPFLTRALRATASNLRFTIVAVSSNEIARGLRNGTFDAGITYLDNEPVANVRALELYAERYVLLTADGGSRSRKPTTTWRHAARGPLALLGREMQNRRIIDAILAEHGEAATPMVETNSITALLAHVRTGVATCIAAHTWLTVIGVPQGVTVLPISPRADQRIGLVWDDTEPEPRVIRSILPALRDARLGSQINRAVSGTV
jgi:DNA-binding transcriptional LysR family regulator